MNLPTCHQYIRRKSQFPNIRDTGLATLLITGWRRARSPPAAGASAFRSSTCSTAPARPRARGRPVPSRWPGARGVVRDEDDLPEPQLGDDGVEVTDLIVGGVRVAGRLIRPAPPEKIKQHDAARRRQVRRQTVVEVYVVREPVHENDRRFRSRVVSDVDPVVVPLNQSLLVGHLYPGTECHITDRA